MKRIVVSTDCPSCGAPLDFSEGSNAVRCAHCRSNLLVTGRGQVLSYYIEPRVEAERARAQAGLALRRAKKTARALTPRLYFVPYYRMTAHDYVWGKPEPLPRPMLDPDQESGDSAARVLGWGPWSTGSLAADLVFDLAGSWVDPWAERAAPVHKKPIRIDAPVHLQFKNTRAHGDIEFFDHIVDKNFIAADAGDLGLYSIGVRSSVLTLRLFERKRVESLGTIVKVDLDTTEAWKRALMLDRDRVVFREIVARRLSLLYFPCWVVQADLGDGNALVVVDGVSAGVVRDDAPLALYAALNSGGTIGTDVASFRPLVCPNCGWDFPVHGDDAVFHCSSCSRSWLLEGKELIRIEGRVAQFAGGAPSKAAPQYLPFWEGEVASRRAVVPAFRYRQLRHVQMLSTRLARESSKAAAEKETGAGREEGLGTPRGGFYGPEDGRQLARFTWAGLAAAAGERIDRGWDAKVSPQRLLWVPFRKQGNFLFDPWFGSNLFANLLN